MKRGVVLMCLFVTGGCLAQEEGHLKGGVRVKESNSIKEISQKREQMEVAVSVYPNPSEGRLFIEGKNGSVITITSVEGTYVGTWLIGVEGKTEITDLPQGSFFCIIQEGENRTCKKVVVL
jgi:hypothetical protein